MNIVQLTDRLAHNASAIQGLVRGVSPEQARWKPAAEEWSILEVINHLADEEQEDFRRRLDLTLHRPGQRWPDIDPAGWVTSRHYQERDLADSLESFLDERRRSLDWLGNLDNPAWESRYELAAWGPMTAGDLALSWIAHDSLHIRQLAQRHHQYFAAAWHPFSSAYAGDW